MTMQDDSVQELGLRGYQCPLPVLKVRNALKKKSAGDKLMILTDDPLAVIDVPNFCNEYDQDLLDQGTGEGNSHWFLVERRGEKL